MEHTIPSCDACPLSHRLAYVPGERRCLHPGLDADAALLVGGLERTIHQDCPLRHGALTLRGELGA